MRVRAAGSDLAGWQPEYAMPEAPGQRQQIAADDSHVRPTSRNGLQPLALTSPGRYQLRPTARDGDGGQVQDTASVTIEG